MNFRLPVLAFPPAVQPRKDKRMLLFIGLPPDMLSACIPAGCTDADTSVFNDKLTKKFNSSFGTSMDAATKWLVGYHRLGGSGESGKPAVWDVSMEAVVESCQQAMYSKGRCDLLINDGCIKSVGPREFKEYVDDWKVHFENVMDYEVGFRFELTSDEGLVGVGDALCTNPEEMLMKFICE